MSESTGDQKQVTSVPDQFPFPYAKPYDIQVNFMKSLYKTLEEEKIGIFESPTGTVESIFKYVSNCGAITFIFSVFKQIKGQKSKSNLRLFKMAGRFQATSEKETRRDYDRRRREQEKVLLKY